MTRNRLLGVLFCLIPLWAGAAETSLRPAPPTPPRIAIIIDDMGDSLAHGLRALRLPGAVTYSFLPHTTYAQQLATSAHKHGKEVMLHLPMASEDGRDTGPGGLTPGMTREELLRTFRADLAAIPHAVGVNNHMGSLLTPQAVPMGWLMEEIHRHGGLYFVDSRTTETTVAQKVAQHTGIPNLRRDVFLDNDPNPEAIAQQFALLMDKAKRRGSAVAIGHPYYATLRFLEAHLLRLQDEGIELIAVSHLLKPVKKPDTLLTANPLILGANKLDSAPESPVVTP